MLVNHGDVNFFEDGILIDDWSTESEFDMLRCKPYSDHEDRYMFAYLRVNINDTWIDRNAVMDSAGMTNEDFDAVQFAIACTEYYSWENFGAGSIGTNANWFNMSRLEIEAELRKYMISPEGLEMPWLQKKEQVTVTLDMIVTEECCDKIKNVISGHPEYMLDNDYLPGIIQIHGKIEKGGAA